MWIFVGVGHLQFFGRCPLFKHLTAVSSHFYANDLSIWFRMKFLWHFASFDNPVDLIIKKSKNDSVKIKIAIFQKSVFLFSRQFSAKIHIGITRFHHGLYRMSAELVKSFLILFEIVCFIWLLRKFWCSYFSWPLPFARRLRERVKKTSIAVKNENVMAMQNSKMHIFTQIQLKW